DDYCVHGPFDSLKGNTYKNPLLYTHGACLPDSLTLNKYGPDIISDSVIGFVEKNKSKPFFIFYPMMLVHQPISPTPDDSAFADPIWDKKNHFDTSFYSSMMHYMDKKIGELITKLKNLGIEDNTVIIFAGDNGSSGLVADYSDEDSILIRGGKSNTTIAGTNVPLIAYWPGTINPGMVNDDLIDFTDFLPTLAGITNIPVPNDYGTLDGISFFPRLIRQAGTPRNWIFNNYTPHRNNILTRWAQTKTYKLYDTSSISQKRLFYNISNDPQEKYPIANNFLTLDEVKIKDQLLDVINSYVTQGTPLISSTPSLSFITDSSLVLKDTIRINGGSTVTASGAVWSTGPDPEISSCGHTSIGMMSGPFSTQVTGLNANTTYYIRAYATNFAGTVYSNQVIFKTRLKPPVAIKATEIDSTKFTANWKAYAGAKNYRLDVSTSPQFETTKNHALNEGFNNGIVPPDGWTINSKIKTNTTFFGSASPSLKFPVSKAQIITGQLAGPATQLKFWIRGMHTNELSSFLVEGFDGNEWIAIANLAKLSKTGETKIFNATSNPPLRQTFIQFRFTYSKDEGSLVFDDVSIKYKKTVPFFVPGYKNQLAKTNSKMITGLKAATNYYYRVRANTDNDSSGNSNVVAVTTTEKDTSIIDTAKLQQAGMLYDNSSANIAEGKFNIHVFPNPSPGEFILSVQNTENEKLQIAVSDIHGKILCGTIISGDSKYAFGKTFAPGEYFVNVNSRNFKKTIKIIKLK
ncbi:MAG TPA: sulfatase-like hydrolase/transferase, partial [Parafilimonas sp.]|nr:sulfatase-like hydrolase/transferase [Parafilimonas sp.]